MVGAVWVVYTLCAVSVAYMQVISGVVYNVGAVWDGLYGK